MIKRMFDVVASLGALIVLWPLLILIGLIVKMDSRGPAIYRSRRAGRWGNSFSILKFRTMVVDAERLGGPSTAADDPRVTRVGKILRKYKLDEVPQLVNVLKGEMSIVGPRPEILPEVERYSAEERQLLSVFPGITDWASLRFRNEGEILRGSPDAHRAYWEKIRPEKIRLGLKYARSHSFFEDMRIVFETLTVVFRGASSDAIE